MPKPNNPRQGSMQFWPRKRAKQIRIRSWAVSKEAKPLGFIGYKAGMLHVMATDTRPKSTTKGDILQIPSTVIECPPMLVAGAVFYKKTLLRKFTVATVLAPKLHKDIKRVMPLPKKQKSLEEVKDFDSVQLLVHSLPSTTGIGTKKPKILEVALGGSVENQLSYIKENLGKSIAIDTLFSSGAHVDVHGITKGKGFQGTVKRFGVPIRQHKAEKTKRGIGNLGAWTPKRVDFRVPQPGKMGHHLRTEYNKQIIQLGSDGSAVTSAGGRHKYGVVKNPYVLLKGSVVGPRKRVVVLTAGIRIKKHPKEAPAIKSIIS